jgi:hypothetical protein
LIRADTLDMIELVALIEGSFVCHPDSGRYRVDGDPRGQLWWSIGWRRVEVHDLALAGRPPIPDGEPLAPPS